MKNLCVIVLLLFAFNSKAQESVGIRFDNSLSWKQVKEKAKKEKKYIFVDVFATWCVPCKQMEREIFPQAEVGSFFNTNFINVALQMDVTKIDNAHVKSWYADAEWIGKTYKINEYPTYLFFNSDGDLVHLFKGSTPNATEFLNKSKLALEPQSQYLTLKSQYKEGKRDTAFLVNLINSATLSGEIDSAAVFANDYLAIDKNWSTKRNIGFIVLGTTKSSDIGFTYLRSNLKLVDAVIGEKKRKELIKTIAHDEVVLTSTRQNGKKTSLGMGMITYSGELIKNVDWNLIKQKLEVNYPDLADEIILESKPLYYQSLNDWENYSLAVSAYAADTKNLDLAKLNTFAGTVLSFCGEQKYMEDALKWNQQVLLSADKKSNYYNWYLKTKCYLLYKLGQKDAAIKSMENYIRLFAAADAGNAAAELEKMKNNEKIF